MGILSAIGGFFTVVGKAFDVVGMWQRWRQRQDDEAVGQAKGANKNLSDAVAIKDEQLKAAAKPDASREEIIAKAKGRKRHGEP